MYLILNGCKLLQALCLGKRTAKQQQFINGKETFIQTLEHDLNLLRRIMVQLEHRLADHDLQLLSGIHVRVDEVLSGDHSMLPAPF